MRKIQSLRVTTIAENLAGDELLGQWGLSFLLEMVDARGDNRKVLLDTSANKEAFLNNVRQLKEDRKVELSNMDCIVISHGHRDHTAATVELFKTFGGTKIYAHPHTFLPRFFQDKEGKKREIGAPEGEKLYDIERAGGEVVLTKEPTEVVPGLWTTGQIERVTSFESVMTLSEGERRTIVVDGNEIDDQIMDDQALWAAMKGIGAFVITGCAHAGPVNTLLQIRRMGNFERIHGLVGGTHLVGRSDIYLNKTIDELRGFKLDLISPCHCTGFKAMAMLWKAFSNAFILNYCGRVIEAGKEPESRLI